MSKANANVVEAVLVQVHAALNESTCRPVMIGICGAQGSGKSTLAAAVQEACAVEGISAAVLSIDDLYKTHDARKALAREVHPLLATRGVPGTHDLALGWEVLDALGQGGPVALPRFDKATDDRCPRKTWPTAPAGCEVLLFEGWCVGAAAQSTEELTNPVNALEREEDREGVWRGYANAALAGEYARLFERIDRLVLLAAPDFAVVREWRLEQEQDLVEPAMDRAAVVRFVAHFERLTRHILIEMPQRADLVVRLGPNREPVEIMQRD